MTFPGQRAEALEALAFVVLPASLGRDKILGIVRDFEHWVQNYRPGADTEHGYGITRVVSLPASPAPRYIQQLSELGQALEATDPAEKQRAVRAALEKANVKELPSIPRGAHIAADLMGFYFYSSEASDLCYEAAIERYRCRGLENSDVAPRKTL